MRRLLHNDILKRVLGCALTVGSIAAHGEWSGDITFESRHFYHTATSDEQSDNNNSLSSELEFYHEFNPSLRFIFTPFFRVDESDSERTHVDVREFNVLLLSDNWDLRVGVGKVFWGTTESQHLVDIINQTDLVESTDGEEKLGQPMVHLSTVRDWGVVDLFVLPGFRERTFAGREGRLRTGLHVDTDDPIYESSSKEHRIDAALRWSHTLGVVDIGLSHFSGTSRDPRFSLRSDNRALVPIYDVIDQTGVDLQLTLESWLLKLEAITRSGQQERFSAVASGFEYTFVGIAGSSADLGVVGEYLFDDRGSAQPFANDVFIGFRYTANDVQSTEALAGFIIDADTHARVFSLEASRRIGDHFVLNIEAQAFSNIDTADPLVAFVNDDYIELRLGYHF